jgi:hypothetical protein
MVISTNNVVFDREPLKVDRTPSPGSGQTGQPSFMIEEGPRIFHSEKRCLAADPGAIQEEQTASGVIGAFTALRKHCNPA